MKRNVGGVDSKLRSLIGSALLGYGLGSGSRGAMLAGLAGLVTAAADYCPVNELMGLDTSENSPNRRSLVDRVPSTRERVPLNTDPDVNEQIRRRTRQRLQGWSFWTRRPSRGVSRSLTRSGTSTGSSKPSRRP